MALTITTTVDPGTYTVRIVAAGGTPPYAVTASPAGGLPDYTVRSSQGPVAGDATARVLVDGQAPLNTPIVYTVTDKLGAQKTSTPAVTVTADGPVLSDATDPTRWLSCVVLSQPPDDWVPRSVWWDVLGASDPFVSIAPVRKRSGVLVLRTTDRAGRAALLTLLLPGRPMLLRSVCPEAVDDVTFLLTDLTDELEDVALPSGPRHWQLTYQGISTELGAYSGTPGRSYADVVAQQPTYADVLLAYATYADLLTGLGVDQVFGPSIITNGSFATGDLTGYSTFWTTSGVTWSGAAGTGQVSNPATSTPVAATLDPSGSYNIGTVPGRQFRVSGRVRSSNPAGTPCAVLVHANVAPAIPDFFQPGTVQTYYPLTAGPAWSPFAVTVTVPAGQTAVTIRFRHDSVALGSVAEWDDLSIRPGP